MQTLSPALAAAKLLERQHAVSAALVLKLGKAEGKHKFGNQFIPFTSVSHQVSEGKIHYLYRYEFEWVARQRQGCFESVNQSVVQFRCTIKLHPLQFHTDSDCRNCWSETEKWSIPMGETFLPLFLFTGVMRYFQLTNWPKQGQVSELVNRDEVSWLTSQWNDFWVRQEFLLDSGIIN